MNIQRLVVAPSVTLICQPDFLETGIKTFFEENNLSDLPKLYAETPVGRMQEFFEDVRFGDQPEGSSGEMLVEFAGRQCYRAWEKGRPNKDYIHNIIQMRHGSVLAHAHYSFQISGISRALSLELNRHSTGNDISQESQRFVPADDMRFVVPPALLKLWDDDLECDSALRWAQARMAELEDYTIVQDELTGMMEAGGTIRQRTLIQKRANEAARYSLPEASETRGLWTFNLRSLRHVIELRGAEDADLEIRRLAALLAIQCKVMCPNTFWDVDINSEDEFGVPTVSVAHSKV